MLLQLKEYGLPSSLDIHEQPDQRPVHPVTELQQFLQKRHIQPPTYDYAPHQGANNTKEYTAICRVQKFNLETKARRKNQRDARKLAATQMIALIEQELECSKQ